MKDWWHCCAITMTLRGRGGGRGRGRGKPMPPPQPEEDEKSVAAGPAKSTQEGVASVTCDGRPDVPKPDELVKFNLPDTYRVKYCALCNQSSLSICEFIEIGCAWSPLLPWGSGTKVAPSGLYCRSWCAKAAPLVLVYLLFNHIHITYYIIYISCFTLQ